MHSSMPNAHTHVGRALCSPGQPLEIRALNTFSLSLSVLSLNTFASSDHSEVGPSRVWDMDP